jgi:HEPN domain-containing protein
LSRKQIGLNKEEHISYWVNSSKRDLARAEQCFAGKDFVFALFCLHLALEKTIKALWVKFNAENFPPRIHNLVKLIGETPVLLSENQLIFLNDLNRFQLEGRYPDYTGKIYLECTPEFTLNMLEKGKQIQKWLEGNTQ